jgi:hypothetical protein
MMNFNLQTWLQRFKYPSYSTLNNIHLKAAFKYQSPMLDVSSFTVSLDKNGTVEGTFKTDLSDQTLTGMKSNGFLHAKKLQAGSFPIT